MTPPRVIMTIGRTASSVSCGTCDMTMSTQANPQAPEGEPFGITSDADGVITDVADASGFLTQYANLVCVLEDCPHRTP